MRDPVPFVVGVPADPTDGAATLRLRIRRRAATTVVEVRGELDLSTRSAFADVLTGAVTASPGRRVVVDLTRCTFLAACGAEVLRRARTTAGRRCGALDVVVGAGGPAAVRVARTVRLAAGMPTLPAVRIAGAACRERTPRPPPHRRTDRFDRVTAALERLPQGRFALCDVCGDEIDDAGLRGTADADRCALHHVARTAQPH